MSFKRMALSLLLLASAVVRSAPIQDASTVPKSPILAQKERAALYNRWLAVRFEKVLPALMRREDIDMWVVICREHNEDPVYWSLVPSPSMFAWRTTMLVYHLGPAGLECLSINRYGGGDLHKEFAAIYKPAWEPENLDPWERLARIIRARDPRKIAINESREFPFADGLSAENKARLVQALGPDLSRRLISSERLAVGWLETRTVEELDFYPRIVAINHQIVREAFSTKVITPGLTTIDDLEWWVRERLDDLHLTTWFPPMFYILRAGSADPAKSRTILPGDLLRCDVGVVYMGLCSDIQEIAYVPRPGETDAPKGLTEAMALGNRLQDILAGEFRAGRTGNEVLAAALAKARAAGLVPRIYSHPLGYNGHGAGPRIGLPDMQDGVPGLGDYALHPDTVYAIELSVQAKIPEWNGLTIAMALEEDASFTARGVSFIDGRQTKIILVK
jgi:hypothetical protein